MQVYYTYGIAGSVTKQRLSLVLLHLRTQRSEHIRMTENIPTNHLKDSERRISIFSTNLCFLCDKHFQLFNGLLLPFALRLEARRRHLLTLHYTIAMISRRYHIKRC